MGSNHPGGCNVGFGDGSVRFLRETIDLNTVLKPLASRSGGEVLPNY
jgi:prepilin-type processing-associated H-X9-DG protein